MEKKVKAFNNLVDYYCEVIGDSLTRDEIEQTLKVHAHKALENNRRRCISCCYSLCPYNVHNSHLYHNENFIGILSLKPSFWTDRECQLQLHLSSNKDECPMYNSFV